MATIFTRIINGEIPSYKIAENEHCYAFLDINPIARGHTLVVPKKEIDYLFDVDDETIHHLMDFSKHIAKAIDKALGTIRTGLIVEGLLVPHAHIHLIPIFSETQIVALGLHNEELSQSEMMKIAEAIQKELEA